MSKIDKNSAKRMLSPVPEDKKFWCNDGQVFSTMEEFETALKNMNTETFEYHVNENKNDFSKWIYDVIGDVDLANSLRDVKDESAMTKKVRKHIAQLKKTVKE